MNIREIIQNEQNYYEINREERNYAAIFFSAICNKNNLIKFLEYYNITDEITDEFGIYFEYSFLRDLWFNNKNEEIKKKIIREKLLINNINNILEHSIEDINKIFGVVGIPSKEYLQYPGKWAISKFYQNFNNDDFLKVCKFKWSFNIKPDIVIHLSKNKAICIEAKLASSEGSYPSQKDDIEIFDARVSNRVKQTDLQKYMMEELLGIKTEFLFLVSNRNIISESHKTITWNESFNCLDLSNLPFFALEMIKNLK